MVVFCARLPNVALLERTAWISVLLLCMTLGLHAQGVQDVLGGFKSPSGDLFQSPIERRRWRIIKYRGDDRQKANEDGLIEAKLPSDITFRGGHINGSAGCGALWGDYKLSGGHLTIHADFLLAGLCLQDSSRQNDAVIRALTRVTQMERKNETMLLLDVGGYVEVVLVPFAVAR